MSAFQQVTLIYYLKNYNDIRYLINLFNCNKHLLNNTIDEDGKTLLHWAVCLGKINIVYYLIGESNLLNCQDKLGLTPLHWSVIMRKTDITNCLACNLACLNIKDNTGKTVQDWYNIMNF